MTTLTVGMYAGRAPIDDGQSDRCSRIATTAVVVAGSARTAFAVVSERPVVAAAGVVGPWLALSSLGRATAISRAQARGAGAE